jgi:hypothetical protein
MHEALPHSLGANHSMCASTPGIRSGEHVYRTLVTAQAHGKRVYVLASHSHFYLEQIYATDYWRDPSHGGVVLPGWIVGTAGAARYPLPPEVAPGPGARAHVYGYLTGQVDADGAIAFAFHELGAADLERSRSDEYVPADVEYCDRENPPVAAMGAGLPAPACLAPDDDT